MDTRITTVADLQAYCRTHLAALNSDQADEAGTEIGQNLWHQGHEAGLRSGDDWGEWLAEQDLYELTDIGSASE